MQNQLEREIFNTKKKGIKPDEIALKQLQIIEKKYEQKKKEKMYKEKKMESEVTKE